MDKNYIKLVRLHRWIRVFKYNPWIHEFLKEIHRAEPSMVGALKNFTNEI